MTKKKISPKSSERKAGGRKGGQWPNSPTIEGQVAVLREIAPNLLAEIEDCDEDIEDRGDDFDFDGDNPTATAALEAVLDLPPVPACLGALPVGCPKLDWGSLRDRTKAVGDQLEAIEEAIGDREAGEFGESLDEALSWFNGF